MIISDLRLQNFRCFEDIQLHFQDDLNVIVANNGGGKTSILDAIAIALGPFLTRLPNTTGRNFGKNDLRVESGLTRHHFKSIAARVKADDQIINWARFERRDKSKQAAVTIAALQSIFTSEDTDKLETWRTNLKQLNQFADSFIDKFNEGIPFQMPILALYGIQRNAFSVPERRRGFQKEFGRFEAFNNCLDPKTNFRKFFEYFYYLESRENKEIRDLKNFEHRVNELEVIRTAITTFFKSFSNPRTDLNPLRFLVDQKRNGSILTLDIRDLSDGYRTTIGVVMDLASRMAEANPQMGNNALKSKGIVMIDEIDMHLHPSWQQNVIGDFKRTFPNIQLICTTHSPQVLSTVDKKNIIIIDSKLEASEPDKQTKGVSSSSALSAVMGVDPVPNNEEANDLSKLRALLESGNGNSHEAQLLKENLINYYGEGHQEIIELRQISKLQQFKEKLLKHSSGPSKGI